MLLVWGGATALATSTPQRPARPQFPPADQDKAAHSAPQRGHWNRARVKESKEEEEAVLEQTPAPPLVVVEEEEEEEDFDTGSGPLPIIPHGEPPAI